MNIVLFGAGLNCNVCIDIIKCQGIHTIIGIIDSNSNIGDIKYGYPVLGKQENLKALIKEHNIEGGLITVGDNYGRFKLSKFILDLVPDFIFVSAIHPSAVISDTVVKGINTIIMPGAIINTFARLGSFCMINTGAQVEHDCILQDYVHLSAGSIMGGKVTIGRFSIITLGVVLFDRINIGENVVVGSGAVVTHDIPDNSLVYGVPAKIIREIKLGEKILKSM